MRFLNRQLKSSILKNHREKERDNIVDYLFGYMINFIINYFLKDLPIVIPNIKGYY